MSSTQPNKGVVSQEFEVTGASIGKAGFPKPKFPKAGRPDLTGSWRPNLPFVSGSGLLITLRKETGVTTGDVLRVPMRFQTPVINEFTRPFRVNVTTFDTISDGQKSRESGVQLLDLSIDTLLMDGPAADSSQGLIAWDGARDPQGILAELNHIAGIRRGSKAQRFRLVVSQPNVWGPTPLLNMLAQFTAITPSQRSGEAGTEYVTLGFLEYDEGEIGRKQRPQKHDAGEITIHVGVDSLHDIAQRSHYHRASAADIIADYNGITGVSYSSAAELAAWTVRRGKPDRTKLKIPASS